MVNISKIIFKTTGLMPCKEVVKTSKIVGKRLADKVKAGKEITPSCISEFLTDAIGRKKAKNIVISDKYEDLVTYMNAVGIKDETVIRQIYEGSASTVLLNPKTKSVLLSLRLNDRNVNESLNLVAHELEHVLNQSLTPRIKLEYLFAKLRGKKYLDKYIAKYGQLLNEKNMDLQSSLLYISKLYGPSGGAFGVTINQPPTIQGLLKHMSIQSQKALGNRLNREVRSLLVNDYKTDKKILNMCKVLLKEESRAYKSGGAVERYWSEINGLNSTNANSSEMMSLLYDETLAQVEKESKKLKRNRIKRFFGIKPKKKVPVMETVTINPDGSKTYEMNLSGKKIKATETEVSQNDVSKDIWDSLK